MEKEFKKMKCKFKPFIALILAAFISFGPAVSFVKIAVSAETISNEDYRLASLTAEEKGYYNKIYSELTLRRTSFLLDGRQFTEEYIINNLLKLYYKVLYDNPELYYVEFGFNYEYDTNYIKLSPHYSLSTAEIKKADRTYKNGVAAMVEGVEDSWSDVEKALYIHDYLVSNFKYDYELEIYNLYRFFLSGEGVCQAYSLAFAAAMRELDIPVSCVVSDELNHMWNIVQIDGKWYNVDVTWDDSDEPGIVYHDNFLQSDDETRKYHESDDWEQDFDCDSTKYDDYTWRDVIIPFVYYENCWYSVDSVAGGVFKYDFEAGTSKKVFSISNKWQDMDPQSYWDGCFSGLAIVDGLYIYNTDSTVMLLDPDSNSRKTITRNSDKGYIYCFSIDENELIYYIREDPTAKVKRNVKVSLDDIPKRSTVSFMQDDKLISDIKYWDGDKIKPIEPPTKEGYEFTGWSPEIPEKMPAQDLTFTAVFSCLHENWDEKIEKDPDCINEGEKKLTCTTCAETKVESIAATNIHNYGEWAVVREPDRKVEGEKQRLCTVCNIVDAQAIEKLPPLKWFENPVLWIITAGGAIVLVVAIIFVKKKAVKASTEVIITDVKETEEIGVKEDVE